MAANFPFVPRSVRHKPAKTQNTSRIKQRNLQNTSTNAHGPGLGPSESICNEKQARNWIKKDQNPTNAQNAFTTDQESPSDELKTNDISSKEDVSADNCEDEIVYFSKNQRWPQDGEPVCIVCGKYGEYICDETEADVCSKECKARNLQLTRAAGKQQEKEFKTHSDEKSINEHGSGSFQEWDLNPQKYAYTVHPQVALLTEEQVTELRSRMEISIRGSKVEKPILEFSQCGLKEQLLKNLKTCGYVTPTPVQMQVIPVALSGQDVLACAQTGSGKTAAFLVPLITRIHHTIASRQNSWNNAQGLVLAPTRELCMQIESQAKELMSGLSNMRTALIVGGMPMPNQIYRLRQGVQIVFATPGRLVEILRNTDVDFSEIQMLVIDEVDVLMQMGFENQVKSILENIPAVRQTLLFSATIPPSVERISSTLLTEPVWISVGAPSAPNMDVKQVILWVEDKSKKKRLFALLRDSKYFTPPILVFVDSRLGADMLSEAIHETCDVRCTSMHGEKSQSERSSILEAFLSGDYDVLVCTGVLGRGLDLRCVKQVINFDMPSNVAEYIHQVGRAGRLGSKGLAITFVNNTNKAVFLDLVETVQAHGVKLPDELLHSPHLSSQQHERERRRKGRKRKQEECYVNRENLMDILKKSTFRRRLKNR